MTTRRMRRVRLRDAKPGLYLMSDRETLLCKTEYGDNVGNQDIYIINSGERYWVTPHGGLDAMVYDVTVWALNAIPEHVASRMKGFPR